MSVSSDCSLSLRSHQARYFENPQVIAENTVPSPEMVGMITSVLVKTAPEREDSETRTVSHRQLHSHSTVYNHQVAVEHHTVMLTPAAI